MTTRRKFLKNAGILSATLALNPLKAEEILPKNKKNQKTSGAFDLEIWYSSQ